MLFLSFGHDIDCCIIKGFVINVDISQHSAKKKKIVYAFIFC